VGGDGCGWWRGGGGGSPIVLCWKVRSGSGRGECCGVRGNEGFQCEAFRRRPGQCDEGVQRVWTKGRRREEGWGGGGAAKGREVRPSSISRSLVSEKGEESCRTRQRKGQVLG